MEKIGILVQKNKYKKNIFFKFFISQFYFYFILKIVIIDILLHIKIKFKYIILKMDSNLNSNSVNLNYTYRNNQRSKRCISNTINRTTSYRDLETNENSTNNIYRMNNLENRISSLEKMLQYLDEFIHLKEEEKDNVSQSNLMINQLNIKIKLLEKEIRLLHKEKEENKETISELSNKIISLEKQINNYNYNNMQDIIFSLSNKEKKLNMLMDDFQNLSKNTEMIINNKLTEKINEFNIFNENKIGELLELIQSINKIMEQNDFKMIKFNENLQNIQKDNLNLVKIISIQEQKFNNFELINNEINSIKEKIRILIEDYNNKLENSFNE